MRFRSFMRFTAALICATVLLAIPLAVTIGYLEPTRSAPSTRQAEARAEGIYQPDRGDSLAVLFAGLRQNGTLSSFALIHADPMNHALSVVILPADFMAEGSEGLMPMHEIFARGGAQAAAVALSNTAGIYIHRSATVPAATFGKIADAAGAVEMMLPVGIDIPEAGAHIEPGRQRMNSTRLMALMAYDGYPGGEAQRLGLMADAVLGLSEKYLSGFGSPSGERLFTAFIGTLSQSNLSMADYEYRRPAFAYLYEQGGLTSTAVVAGWSESETGRFLTAEAIAALQAACYPLEGW